MAARQKHGGYVASPSRKSLFYKYVCKAKTGQFFAALLETAAEGQILSHRGHGLTEKASGALGRGTVSVSSVPSVAKKDLIA